LQASACAGYSLRRPGAASAPLRPKGLSALSQARAISPGVLLVMLASMAALVPTSMDGYLPAIPSMVRDVNASAAAGQLTLASFFLGLAIGQLFYGRSADRFGRRPVFFAGASLYIGASLGCALAPNIETLIAMRFFQAIGACAATVISRAVIFDLYDSRKGAQFLSHMLLIQGMAPLLAPLIGGWIIAAYGWRPIFFMLTGIGVLLVLGVYLFLPETRTAEDRKFSSGETAIGSYLAVLRNGPLMQVTLAGAFGSAAIFAYLSNAPQLLIETYKIPPEQFGYYFGVNVVGFIAFAQINRRLLSKHTTTYILNRATILAALSAFVMLLCSLMTEWGKFAVLIPLFITMSFYAFIMPNATALAQGYDLKRPGAVAAVGGSLTFATASLVAALSSFTFNGTATPMAAVMMTSALVALALRIFAPAPPVELSRGPPA
jgi:DHA1 family bicyclomycin/chloramphenicol resistance-like MFS transporter